MRDIKEQLGNQHSRTEQTMHLLHTVSPLKTLGRGYTIARDKNNAVIRSIAELRVGDQITSQLADGEIISAVTETTNQTLKNV
jgi:exodeoxyribonuclease VII large subunit